MWYSRCILWLACLGVLTQCLVAAPLTLEGLLNQLPKPDATVQSQVASSPSLKEVKIKSVKIKGLKTIPESIIRNAIAIPDGTNTNNFRLVKKLKVLSKMGVFESVQHKITKDKTLILTLKENPVVKSIVFEGNRAVDDVTLLNLIEVKKGEVLNNKNLGEDVATIKAYYEESGYMLAKVQSVSNDPDGNVYYKIAEGVLESISITGNLKTQDYVIRREIQSQVGQAFHGPTYNEDLRRIFNLGFFANLNQEFLPGSEPGLYKLNIILTEKPTNASLSFGGTYQAISGLSFFSNVFWDNLFGTGQTLQVNGQFGQSTVYQFKYVNPWMWDERKSLSLKAWRRRGNVDTSLGALGGNNYQVALKREEADGGEVGFGIPLSYDLRTHHYFLSEDVRLLDFGNHFYTKQSYRFNISLDSRDNFMDPTKGQYNILSIEKGFPFFETSLEFIKFDVTLSNFFSVQKNQVLASKLSIGYLDSPHIRQDGVFNREFYRVGGSYSVRGYKDYEPYAIGSRSIVANLEYRFLLGGGLQFILFSDAGLATDVNKITFREARVTSGIGVRFIMPALGPVRVDWGIPKLDSLDSTIIHFNVGHTF